MRDEPTSAEVMFGFAVGLAFLWAVSALSWLFCRLFAERCPRCGSKWDTELFGEWGGELWDCHACGHHWEVRP